MFYALLDYLAKVRFLCFSSKVSSMPKSMPFEHTDRPSITSVISVER